MSEQPLDLRSTLHLIARGRRLVAALTATGLLLTVGYGIVRPATPATESLVLLPPTASTSAGTPVRDMATQIAIATSTDVLAAAGRAVQPVIDAHRLGADLTVTAKSEDVLAFKVHLSPPARAEALADAVAQQYITYVTQAGASIGGKTVAGLQAESDHLTAQITTLQNEIDAAEAHLAAKESVEDDSAESTLVGALRNEQADVSLTLDNVNSQIESAGLQLSDTAAGTRMLQSATSLLPGSPLRWPLLLLIGLMTGLLTGSVLAVVRGRGDRRLRLRVDMASALGVPVLGSCPAGSPTSAAQWSCLLVGDGQSATERWALRRVLTQLDADAPGRRTSLRLVSLAGDTPALTVAPRLAVVSASGGITTALVTDKDPALDELRAAALLMTPENLAEGRLSLRPADATERKPEVALEVQMAVMGAPPATGPDGPPTCGPGSTMTVLVVSSGFASAEALARIALALTDAGHGPGGLVVVNPDPSDRTTGWRDSGRAERPATVAGRSRSAAGDAEPDSVVVP